MIIVKIELHSAITGRVTEIGRMRLCNDGTSDNATRGAYNVEVMRRGTDKVQKRGRVENYPRLAYSVWELVRRALVATLGKWPIHPGEPEEFNADVLANDR